MIKIKPNKGDIREDGKRYDGYTWREVGVNHHMNNRGLIYFKREYRTIDGYLKQGGNLKKIKYNAPDVSDIGKVVTLLYDQQTEGFLYVVFPFFKLRSTCQCFLSNISKSSVFTL